MLSVEEARSSILALAETLPVEEVLLTPSLLGSVLAEDVASDLDMPPYDKAMMDGYAVRCADLCAGRADLVVVEEILAGKMPTRHVVSGQASRIMTGAPMPLGADSVVMIERTTLNAGERVLVDDPELKAGKNVLLRGREMRVGDVVLGVGSLLRPQEFGLLAAVGRTSVRVYPRPSVALLSTGDELVEAGETPGPGQIRNSNGPMLTVQVTRAGATPHYLGIARDRVDELRSRLSEGLAHDVLILSGGVSAGKLDLVPGVLRELGVEPRFHKIRMKPGKPLFFGTKARHGKPDCLVFGLPGNPVSALVCFELFLRPALRALSGQAPPGPTALQARLAMDWDHQSDRPTYHPSQLESTADGWSIRPLPWFGSADLRALARANALALFPEGSHRFTAGEVCSVLPMDHRTE